MTSTDDLQRRYDRLRVHHDAILAALKDTTGFQFYRDGVAATLDVAESVRMHATWGPDATPNDGLKLGLDGVKDAVRKFARGIETGTAGRLRPPSPTPDGGIKERGEEGSFQERVDPWLIACFGEQIARDRQERTHRFLEEALELVQAAGCTAHEAHQLVDYVYGRPAGEMAQEVGGVMTTLAAFCLAHGLDMHEAGEAELARIWTKVEKIRAKQAAKPKHSPLPEAPASPPDTPSSQESGVGETEGWRSMDSAPAWEEVEVKVGCMTFRAKYVIGASLTEDERICDQWQATREGEHPPCWSEGACWSSNIDHNPSMQPEAWRPVSAPRPSQREG